MPYEVKATAEFDACLDEAVAYRVDNYGLRSARRLLDAVDETSGLLAGSPLLGSPVDTNSSEVLADRLRWMRIDSYIAIYRADEDSHVAYLLKLLHGSSNWRRRVLS